MLAAVRHLTRKLMLRIVRPLAVALAVTAASVACSSRHGDRSTANSRTVDCRQALAAEYRNQTAWWTIGNRPAACDGVSNEEFARLADEVTDASATDRCRSDLHVLFKAKRTWAEPGRFPASCVPLAKKTFDRTALEAGQWSMQDEYIAHAWPVEVIGTPTSRPPSTIPTRKTRDRP